MRVLEIEVRTANEHVQAIEVAYVAGAKLPDTRVRLIGVNTPESTTEVEPYGNEAAAYTKKDLKEKTVWLEKDLSETDKWVLRYVWLTSPPAEPTEPDIRTHLFNAILVLGGYAQVATYPPDVKFVDYCTKFQHEARDAERGLWGLDGSSGSTNKKASSASSSTTKSVAKASGAHLPPQGRLPQRVAVAARARRSPAVRPRPALGSATRTTQGPASRPIHQMWTVATFRLRASES